MRIYSFQCMCVYISSSSCCVASMDFPNSLAIRLSSIAFSLSSRLHPVFVQML